MKSLFLAIATFVIFSSCAQQKEYQLSTHILVHL